MTHGVDLDRVNPERKWDGFDKQEPIATILRTKDQIIENVSIKPPCERRSGVVVFGVFVLAVVVGLSVLFLGSK